MPTTPFGEAFQMAFVPSDFEASLQHWLTLGAGPFFVATNRKFPSSTFRGQGNVTGRKPKQRATLYGKVHDDQMRRSYGAPELLPLVTGEIRGKRTQAAKIAAVTA